MSNDVRLRLSLDGATRVASDLEAVDRKVEGIGTQSGRASALTDKLATGLKTLLPAISIGVALREYVQATDAMAGFNGRLQLATRSSAEFARAQTDVYAIAQRQSVGLIELGQLYSKLSGPIGRLGGTTAEVAGITEAMAASLRITGAGAAESASAILQFAQAMGSGVLRGEEFNAVHESAPRLMKALGDSLGKTSGELRKMAEEGKLTADVVGNALLKQVLTLQAEAASMPDTVGNAFTRLKNDALKGAEGFEKATGVAGAMADTLGGVAGVIREVSAAINLDLTTSVRKAGDGFDATGLAIAVVGTSLETLVVGAANVSYVLKSIGREAGGIAAQIVAFATGDWDAVKAIRQDMIADAEAARKEVDRFSASVVGSTQKLLNQRDALKNHSISAQENASELQRLAGRSTSAGSAFKALAGTTDEAAEAAKKHAEQQRKLFQAGQELLQGIFDKTTAYRRELELGRELTQAEKEQIDLTNKLRDGKIKLVAAAERMARAAIDENEVLREQIATTRSLERAVIDAAKARDAAIDATLKEITTLDEAIAKQRAENDVLRGVKDAVDKLERAKLEEMATSAERAAIVAMERNEDIRQYEAFKLQAAKLRELAALKGEGVHLEMAKQSADEWAKTTDSIADGLTDALMRGFEAGKGFGRNLLDTLKNAFKTTVLQPTIKAIMRPVSGAIGSLFGGSAFGSTGTYGGGSAIGGAGNILGTLGNLGSLFGAGGLSGALSAGAGWLTGAASFGQVMGAAGSLLGTGTGAGIMSGLGMAAGALGPIALGLMALSSLRHKVTPHVGGSAFANASGVTEALNSSIGFGLANHDRAAETVGAVKGVAGSSAQALNALALAFGGTADFGVGAGFADDTSKDGAWGHLRITRAGQILRDWQGTSDDKWPGLTFADGEEGWKQYGARVALDVRSVMEQIDMPAWARASLDALGEGAGLDQLIATAEQIEQTKVALESMADALRPMGGLFGSIGDLSSDAQHQLAAFAGGIEALASKAQSFVQAYYSADEQAAVSAASIAAALTGAGLDISGLDTKAEYRALLESRDLTTEAGRRQFAALLDASGAFAELSTYLGENSTTLDVLATAAPALIALPQLVDDANAAAGLTGEAIDVGLAGVVSAVTASGDSIVAELQAVRESLEAGLAAVAANTASAARDLVDLNNVIGEGA